MKIRKRVNSSGTVSWQLDLGIVGGKRKQLSFPTKDAAAAAMADKKPLRQKHGDEALVFNELDRQRYAAAETRLRALGATLEEAVAFFVAHHQGRAELPFGSLVERCYEAKLALKKDRDYARGLRRLGQAFARTGHGARPAHEISKPDVERWLFSNGWSPKTQHVYLTDLTTIFQFGIAQKHLSINPCKDIERPQLKDKPPEILDVAACTRLMQAALATESPELRRGTRLELLAYVGICLFAGIRPEETQKLTWHEVNLEERFIEVRALIAKTRKRRIVTISDNLAAGWPVRKTRPATSRRWASKSGCAPCVPSPKSTTGRKTCCGTRLPVTTSPRTAAPKKPPCKWAITTRRCCLPITGKSCVQRRRRLLADPAYL